MLNTETKVGLFVLTGIAILLMFIISLGNINFEKTYRLNILFNDIAGLPEKAQVLIAGVEVGRVEKIELFKEKAKVIVRIKKNIKIHRDTQVKITSIGIIGTKYLEMTLGTAESGLLKDGDTIEGERPVSFHKTLTKITEDFERVKEIIPSIGETERIQLYLTSIFENLNQITAKVNQSLGKNGESIKRIMENIEEFSSRIKGLTEKMDIESFDKSVQAIAANLDILVSELKEGEGLLSKLLNDKRFAQRTDNIISNLEDASLNIKTTINNISFPHIRYGYSLDYDINNEEFLNNLFVNLRKKDKFGYLGVENIRENKESNSYYRKNSFTLQLGKEIKSFSFSLGLIRSSAGMKLYFSPLRRTEWRIGTSIFNISRKVNDRIKPYVNLESKLRLLPGFFLKVCKEDLFNDSQFTTGIEILLGDKKEQ